MPTKMRGLCELYAEDPDRADWLVFGRRCGHGRRGFLKGAGLATIGGLPEAPGQEEVFYTCSACHSIRLVTQHRLPRRRWDQLLDWMVEKHGMAPLPPEERALILDYLAAQLNPEVPR
jgi:hypothetical protein